MPRPSTTLRLGDVAPSFSLTDATSGRVVTLDTLLRDRRGALLVFHRGMW
jgi:peroxiredoxin